jgi:hypothetical protein
MKPPPKLSFNLNLVDLCVSGFWFCRSCYKVTEPTENYAGTNVCLFCASPRIKWNPPIFEPSETQPSYENQKATNPV